VTSSDDVGRAPSPRKDGISEKIRRDDLATSDDDSKPLVRGAQAAPCRQRPRSVSWVHRALTGQDTDSRCSEVQAQNASLTDTASTGAIVT
jgi:hypothetical protein